MEDKQDPIKEVWEEYKHLDLLLSDPEWVSHERITDTVYFALWQAIKKYMEGK